MIPLARAGCVTGIVVVIIIVSVTVSAHVAAVPVPPLPPLSLSSFRSSEGCVPPPLPPPTPMGWQCTTSSTPMREPVQSGRIAVRHREEEGGWQFFLPPPLPPPPPPPPSVFGLVFLQLSVVLRWLSITTDDDRHTP